MTLTMKEYLQAQPRHARIPEYLMTCGPLLDLLNERDELREQLEAVAKAEPLNEESETLDWLQPDELIKVEVDSVGVEVCPRCHQSVYGHPFGLPCGTYSASDITRGGTLKFPQGLTFATPDTKVTVKMERPV